MPTFSLDLASSLLEAAPDAIVGVRADGEIVLANSEAERLFGYSRDELVGQPIEILVPVDVRERHRRLRARYLADPRPRPMPARGMELAGRRRDGGEFPAEISLGPLETDEGTVIIAAARDVTDWLAAQAERERLRTDAQRRHFGTQLQQAQRLESLGQLAGGVAHDFNNLLGVIVSYAAFVAEEVNRAAAEDGGQWGDVQRDIEQIQRAADRASVLTHQLLAFGRRDTVQPRVLDLNQVVADLESLLHRTLGEHIELHTCFDRGVWPVTADPGRLEQVLINLAVNARDAMPGGGVLTIGTTNIDVDPGYAAERPDLRAGPHACLRVRDTGVGMSADVAARAFEPFFTTKPKGDGTGLGLATVYGTISQIGGYVDIESEPGVGTTIRCLIPADTTAADSSDEQAVVLCPPTRCGQTVLVVEDQPALLEVTRRILARNGYQVLTAASADEAIPIATNHAGPIHLLLTDVIMPGMPGKELASRIRSLRTDIRVLYMSGYAHPILMNEGKIDPGVILLEKPFSEDILLTKTEQALDPSSPG